MEVCNKMNLRQFVALFNLVQGSVETSTPSKNKEKTKLVHSYR